MAGFAPLAFEPFEQPASTRLLMLAGDNRAVNADDRHAILLIFQGMDAAGKDGAIRHVMSGVNPQGCQVFSLKHPNADELEHDFLWQTTRDFPPRGKIGIFNRSYYEEVLILRVHPSYFAAKDSQP
jgi:polyphosphate kinase 2 (PPK2 family)